MIFFPFLKKIERFGSLINLAVDFLVHGLNKEEGETKCKRGRSATNNLSTSLASLMITELQLRWENPKRKALLPNVQLLRRRLLSLVNSGLSPGGGSSVEGRLKVVRLVNNQFRNPDVLKYLFEGQHGLSHAFVTYLEELILAHKEEMPVDDIIGCKQFFDFLQTCGMVSKKTPSTSERKTSVAGEGEATPDGAALAAEATRADAVRFEVDKLIFKGGRARTAFSARCRDMTKKFLAK